MSWALAAKLIATAGAGLLVYGVWMERLTLAWIGWLVAFAGAEGLGVLLRATLSGHVWALYAFPVAGAAAVALVLWLNWHLVVEHFHWPALKRGWWDDAGVGVGGFLAGLWMILTRGKRNR